MARYNGIVADKWKRVHLMAYRHLEIVVQNTFHQRIEQQSKSLMDIIIVILLYSSTLIPYNAFKRSLQKEPRHKISLRYSISLPT